MTIICKGGNTKTAKNPQEKNLGRPPPEDSLEINDLKSSAQSLQICQELLSSQVRKA